MAIENNVIVHNTNQEHTRRVRTASKSFTSSSGSYANSFMAVPAGETWDLQSVRISQNEGFPREVSMRTTDGDGTEHAVLTMDCQKRITCEPGEAVAYDTDGSTATVL